MERVFVPLYNATLEGETFTWFHQELARNLPRTVNVHALYETARQLVGVELTPPVCYQFAWLLAGNLPLLSQGYTVKPWSLQPADEWVPVQVIRVERIKNRFNDWVSRVHFQALASRAVGMTFWHDWSRGSCLHVASRVGFTSPYSSRFARFPFSDARQFVSLRLVAWVEAAKSREQPWFFEIACPANFLQWNREILGQRFHQAVVPDDQAHLAPACPQGFRHHCHTCPIGYEECEAATHRRTYLWQPCTECQKDAYFDPERDSPICIRCTEVRERNDTGTRR